VNQTASNVPETPLLPQGAQGLGPFLQRQGAAPEEAGELAGQACEIEAMGLGSDAALAAGLFPLWDAGRVRLEGEDPARRERLQRLLEGIRQLGVIDELDPDHLRAGDDGDQSERVRKMLLAMAADARLVVIKLARRVRELRRAKLLPDAQRRRLAYHTLEIYAPLANRLGIWQLKWELEDLALRYLDPEIYHRIARWLAERRDDREAYIRRVMQELDQALRAQGISAQIYGRPKHIYSIWRKLQHKDIGFDSLFDVRAVRVLVESIPECYAVLGAVHSRWYPIPGQFDDYIAAPKENLYRSLHTAVLGPEGKPLEVQIRTRRMHEHAELGVAAHWRYKEGARPDSDFDRRINWLRSLLEHHDRDDAGQDFLDSFRSEVLDERVYVLTPQDEVVDLARGATPLDFAYAIHTEVGHRCRGARVNGAIAPLTRKLENGDRVEILTGRDPRPSRDWLVPQQGYLATARARSKVRSWFRQQDYEANIAHGRQMLERELQRLGAGEQSWEGLATKLGYERVNDFLAALGYGDLTSAQVAGCLQPAERRPPHRRAPSRPHAVDTANAVSVLGVGNLLSSVAQCCRPVPPEPVTGYITRLRGVSIHRADCHNVLRLARQAPERIIEVSWGDEPSGRYPVRIHVIAHDRAGLLRDVTSVVTGEHINVLGVTTATDPDTRIARMDMTVEVSDVPQLSRLLNRVGQLANVIDARRLTD